MFLPSMPPHEIERLVEWDYYPEIRNDERRHIRTHLAARREQRLDPIGTVLAKFLNGGVIFAVVSWPARLVQVRGHKGLSGESGKGVV